MTLHPSRKGWVLFLISFTSVISLACVLPADNQEEALSVELRVSPVIGEIASVKILPAEKAHAAASPLLPIVDQEDIQPDDRLLLDTVLRWMPPFCPNQLKHLVVRYDPKAERGQATASAILLRGGMAKSETIAVLIHECGHVIDLGTYKGTMSAGESRFPDGDTPTYNDDPSVEFYKISWQNSLMKKSGASKSDFVSGYAMKDPWEDIGESIVYFALHKEEFAKRAKKNEVLAQKLAWVEAYVFGPTFKTAESGAWDGKIVWDVTKMEHGLSF